MFIQKAFPCIQRFSNWAVRGNALSGQTITAVVKSALLSQWTVHTADLLGGERKWGCTGVWFLLNGV